MIEDQTIHPTTVIVDDTGCMKQGADLIAPPPLAHPNKTSS